MSGPAAILPLDDRRIDAGLSLDASPEATPSNRVDVVHGIGASSRPLDVGSPLAPLCP